MSTSVKKVIIPNQKTGQHNKLKDNLVPENIERCSPRQGSFLMNSPSTSAVENLPLGSESRNASALFSEITMQDGDGSIEKSVLGDERQIYTPVCYSANTCTTLDNSALQKNYELARPSTSTKTEFTNSAEFNTQSAYNIKELDELSPLNKRLKRSSSPVKLQNKACLNKRQESPSGFAMRCNPKKIEFPDMAASDTSTMEENFFESNSLVLSSNLFDEDSSIQPTTESFDSEKEISCVGIQQSECDHGSQKSTSLNFPNEIKNVFENIFKSIDCFSKHPLKSTEMVQQYLSHRRQFVALESSQQVRLETVHRLAACLKSRVILQQNALKYTDTQSASTSREHVQEPKENTPRPVAESSVRNKLLYLHTGIVNDLKMLMHLSKLILEKYANESGIDFEKIFDYVLCFEVMKEDYSENLKRFKNMERYAKSDSERCRYERLLLIVRYLIKVLNKFITKVEYGVFLLKLHEKLHKEVWYTSTRIKQMVRMIKISEFRSKEM